MNILKRGKYRHYKGKLYEVIDLAIDSESLEEMVVYRPLYGEGRLWVRPLKMFIEDIMIHGQLFKRFEFLGDLSQEH